MEMPSINDQINPLIVHINTQNYDVLQNINQVLATKNWD